MKNVFLLLSLMAAIFISACGGGVSTPAVGGGGGGGGGGGTLSGYVRDAVSNAGLAGVTINITSAGGTNASATTDSNGIYTTALASGTYSLNILKTGYINASIVNVDIAANVTTTVETVLQVATAYSGIGTVSGTVKNAFTGLGLSSVTLNFRSGINTTTGAILATATTDTIGNYSVLTLFGGNYTAEAILAGYTTGYFTVTTIGGQTTLNQDGTITQALVAGETRIVLTWGATPFDLDSHLTGPVSGSATRFHTSFMNFGSSLSSPFAALDVDDTYQYGPETTTIYQQATGVYRFSVHDYSNLLSTTSTALSTSGVQVKVYSGSNPVRTFTVPVNQVGTLWTVFEMNGTTITPINTMSNQSSPSAVQ